MRCHNFFCVQHKSGYMKDNCKDFITYGEDCPSRKRYNRTIAPLLAWWNNLTQLAKDIFLKLGKLLDNLNKARDDYHGRRK